METFAPMYDSYFDARKYLDVYYSVNSESQEIDIEAKFGLGFLNNLFSTGRIKGETLIEIGVGPCILHILPACENFEHIYLADSFQGNLQEIEKWLRNSSDAFDWSPYLNYVCALENHRSAPEDKVEKIRKKVSLMECDVAKSNPLQPKSLPLMSCVMVSACLTCSCKSVDDFKAALKNVTSLIKPGGHLIFCDYSGASFYQVGNTKFPMLSIDVNIVKEAVAESGCEMEEFQMLKEFEISKELFDCKIVFWLLARKL